MPVSVLVPARANMSLAGKFLFSCGCWMGIIQIIGSFCFAGRPFQNCVPIHMKLGSTLRIADQLFIAR